MKNKCQTFKKDLSIDTNLQEIIPFEYKIINKDDCSHISGKLIYIPELITITDVRIIKWLTGYTVDACFYESPNMSSKWVKNKTLIKKV